MPSHTGASPRSCGVWVPDRRSLALTCPGRRGVSFRFNCHTARGYASAFSRRDAPEFWVDFHPQETRGRRESRMRAAPAVSRAIRHNEKRTRAYRFSGGNPAFPARWVTALFALSSVSRALLPPSLRRSSPQSLAPASGARTTRLRRPLESRSSVATFASTASHRTFVTTRDPPLSSGETREAKAVICPTC
jgi:hypothetical protein